VRERDEQRQIQADQLRTLVDRAPLGVYFLDADFRLRQINPIAAQLFADFPGGAIGRDFGEILHTLWNRDRADDLVRIFRHTLETGEPYHVPEFAERRADLGELQYYDWRIERIMLPDRRYGVVCYFQDISDQVNARLAIARSEERYRTLFTSISEGFCVIEVLFDAANEPIDYRFVETNPAFERHTGIVAAEGKRALELVPNLERRWIERYGRIAVTGESERFVEYSEAMDRWFEVEAFGVGDPEQRRVALLFTDITERRRAEEALLRSEERLRLAKAAAGIGIHDFNPSTGAIEWDEHTRRIWGVGPREPITFDLWLAGIHPDDRDAAQGAVQRALDPDGAGVYFAEYRVTNREDGITRWVQVTGHTTFAGGAPVRLVGTVHDVSGRKRAEEALLEADRRKSEFLSTLSHELRSPLAAIRTATSLLARTHDNPARAKRATSIIGRQTSQLVRLVDDLLDISRISRGKLHLQKEPVDLVALVHHCVGDVSAIHAPKRVALSTALPAEVIAVAADSVRLSQVVSNLLDNAFKFTPPGGEIRVTVARKGTQAIVRVADTGIGMTAEERAQVFEMFAQGQPSQGDGAGGLGIGLSLIRSIVELHGGTIEAHSGGPGQGSEFVVRLRAAETAHPERDRRPSAGGGAARPQNLEDLPPSLRIVVAEDHRDALESLALWLRTRGHDVATAVDGHDALEKVWMKRPDIVLLDLHMPGLDGYEVAQRIRAQPWGQGMRLIALTGWGQEDDKRRSLEAGFDEHLTKPADARDLDETLRL
jgi:PAS domain S-box-containing protein